MKIIFCLHHFLPDFIAGTEMYTLRLAQHLKLGGVEVVIVIPNFNQVESREYEFEGTRVICYAENSVNDRKMIMGKSKPLGLSAFADILHKEKPDLVHFHELSPGMGIGIFHVSLVHQLKIPLILTFHLSYYTCFKGSLVLVEKTKCDGIIDIKRCTRCIYQSKNIEGVKATLLSKAAFALYRAGINPTSLNNSIGTALGFPFVIREIKEKVLELADMAEKIVVLGNWYKEVLEKNGVPAEKMVYIKQGLTIDGKSPTRSNEIAIPLKVVFVGRISELKGLHLLIDAVCSISEENISLHIYGPETEDNFATACRKKTNNKNNIHWGGIIPADQVIPMLSAFDLLCLPSTFSEMSPLVIQEAFAAGIPVLASDVYGNAEQIQEGINGWLFGFKKSMDLAEKLLYLIGHLDLLKNVKNNLPASVHNFQMVASKHLELYSSVVNHNK
jgi:glycosyltransferase involved in cell wall biosynthesis